MRGFFTIGLHNPKGAENVGGVLRAAYCYGAASVAISGARFNFSHPANTPQAHRHMPVMRPTSLLEVVPEGARMVAVEVVEGAVPLPSYKHPQRAFYVFGPEDGSLPDDLVRLCDDVVRIPTRTCMNLAACVNVVLYDRAAKIGGM